MKHFPILLFICIISITSCNSENNGSHNSDDLKESKIITFSSELHPNKTDWDLNKTYKDTLEFVEMDDNYDYPYAIFKTENGNLISFVFHDDIHERYHNGLFAIEWNIDSLYEAGEGEELYYSQCLLNYSVVSQSPYFGDFLTEFIQAYSSDSAQNIQKYISEEIEFSSASKNGLYCIISQPDLVNVKSFMPDSFIVNRESLVGDPCNGYPNLHNGMYFEKITYEDMPWYEIPTDEHVNEKTFPINPSLVNNEINKVSIIVDEMRYVQLYFLKIDDNWYLWAEDYCDCSA